jgi:hypothetical protein
MLPNLSFCAFVKGFAMFYNYIFVLLYYWQDSDFKT